MAAATAMLIGGAALSGGVGLLNSYNQSRAIRLQGAYQRQVAEMNAQTSDLLAKDAVERGDEEARKVRLKARQLVGVQRVGYAGQGVDVNRDTALTVQDEAYTMGETDALTARNNAWREAWGYKTQATNTRFEGGFKQRAANIEAHNTLVTGGLDFLDKGLMAAYKVSA